MLACDGTGIPFTMLDRSRLGVYMHAPAGLSTTNNCKFVLSAFFCRACTWQALCTSRTYL